ncbi:ATP-grasp domain-containing protein [Halorarius halobius]|uniref:ATP-grasp domain-containing protein n=1 Tax=Halorarius halobius TaxID=2962671 RepID=UPI0020CCE671|nr:ATP-grasp domain-containing protein [Halorarius halobius]
MAGPTVLIPGAGGPAAVGAIQSLRRAGFDGRIVATDASKRSAGLHLADEGYTVPRADDEAFFDAAFDLIVNEGVDVILPTSGFDIEPYARHRDQLRAAGVVPVISPPESIDTCTDKAAFDEAMRGVAPLPETHVDPDPRDVSGFPRFVKPVRGKGSEGATVVHDRADLELALRGDDRMLVQEYLPGTEYTVDVLSDLHGNALRAVPRERLATKGGISTAGQVVHDEDLSRTCRRVAESLGLAGPTCMQFKRDDDGTAKLIDVNPRLGGGTVITTFAGVNLPRHSLELVAGVDVDVPEPKEVTVLRYWDQFVAGEGTEEVDA